MGQSWQRNGCLGVVAIVALVVIVIGVASGVAVMQNRATVIEHESVVQQTPAPSSATDRLRLRLDVHTAMVSITPVPAGEPMLIDAFYDTRRYELRRNAEHAGAELRVSISLRPRGSASMALLRVKLGGEPARLRIALPRGIPLDIEGDVARSLAALELGGLSLVTTDLDVTDGAVKVSFVEPLPVPMESISISGSKGSLSVVGLGNASPREARFVQRIGVVDLDLRGAWSRDARVSLSGGATGGSLWLPQNVNIEGLDHAVRLNVNEAAEVPRPTLSLHVEEHLGRFAIID